MDESKREEKKKNNEKQSLRKYERASLLDFSESEQRSPRLFLRRLSITKVWVYEVL